MIWYLLAPTPVSAEGNIVTQALQFLNSFSGGYSTIDGKTWAEMTIKERLTSYNWTNEIYVFLTFFVYIVGYIWGRNANKQKVDNFLQAASPVLRAQFGVVGCSPKQPVIKDSNTRYTTYASGRLNVESLLARFRLIDRHNVLTYAMSFFVPSLGSPDCLPDRICIELTPTDPQAFESGIFAILNKETLSEVQEDKYFFKLAKTVDNPELPSPIYLFSLEHNDQISALFTPELRSALAMEGAANVLRFVGYSDVPSTKPTQESQVKTHPRVYLELNFPKNSAENAVAAKLLEATIDLVDVLATKKPYRASTLKRIDATRDQEFARIRKADEELKREEIEAKKAEERREAARRERQLSEKEQRNLQKKENDKKSRKQKQKMTRRAM